VRLRRLLGLVLRIERRRQAVERPAVPRIDVEIGAVDLLGFGRHVRGEQDGAEILAGR
jgi:hypothetical protein